MEFRCKKTENCFAGARTYEYELPVTGKELTRLLADWDIRENHRFRWPVLSARREGMEIKGTLAARVVNVNFTEENWEAEKQARERRLEETEASKRPVR